MNTAITPVSTGIFFTEPPTGCPASTTDAMNELAAFRDSLSDLLTYNQFLEDELVDDCGVLKGAVDNEITIYDQEL